MKKLLLTLLVLSFTASAVADLPARLIQFRRGLCADLPTLSEGEPGYCTDTHDLYLGTDSGNLLVYPPAAVGAADIHLSNLVTPVLPVSLDFGGFKGFNLANPTSAQDAATKAYVDTKLALAGGTLSGVLDLGSNLITNVSDPVNAQDAATKVYTDTSLSAKVDKSGDSMSGILDMGSNQITNVANPVNAQDAATKSYISATSLAKAGDTMAGILDMGTHYITNVVDPVNAQDAATKNYVDTSIAAIPAPSSLSGSNVSITATGTVLDSATNGIGGGQSMSNTTQWESQGFTAAANEDINLIQVGLNHIGTQSGALVVEIRSDNSGQPSASVLATSDPVDPSTLSTGGPALVDFTFSTPFSASSGTTYWFVVNTSGVTFSSGHIDAELANDTGGYEGIKCFESVTGGASWSSVSPYQLHSFIYAAGSITVSPALNMTGHNITNVADPVAAQDAATKAYVDAHAASAPVVVRYHTSSAKTYNTAVSSGTNLDYDQVDYDPDSLVTTGSNWVFTAPHAGYYHINVSTVNTDPMTTFTTYVSVNDVMTVAVCVLQSGGPESCNGSTDVHLSGGDTISVNADTSVTTLSPYPAYNWIAIHEIK